VAAAMWSVHRFAWSRNWVFLGDVAVGSFAILLPLFLCLTCFHITGCIVSDSGLCTGTLFGGVPWVTRGYMGAFVPADYASPCPGFNRGKTAPGGGRGSRSPRFFTPFHLVLLYSLPK